jgi:hypothetical protein
MQARGSSAQNQQNQNPNVNATAASTSSSAPAEAKTANLDSVLEMSIDKRNSKSGNRGGKRKRTNLPVAEDESEVQ